MMQAIKDPSTLSKYSEQKDTPSQLSELELYMNEIMNKGFTDLNWWKLKSVIYPSLFALANKYLVIPLTGASVEVIFNCRFSHLNLLATTISLSVKPTIPAVSSFAREQHTMLSMLVWTVCFKKQNLILQNVKQG